jgi:hypothetical protein
MLHIYPESYASLGSGAVVSNVAQDNRRNAKLSHLGQRSSAKIVRGPSIRSELVSPDDIRDYVPADAKSAIGVGEELQR